MLVRAEEEIAPARLALIGVGDRGERLARQAACGFAAGEHVGGTPGSRIEELDRADPDVVILLTGLERSSLDDTLRIVRAARSFRMLTVVVAAWPSAIRDPRHLAAIDELATAASSFVSVPGRPGAEGLVHDPLVLEATAIAVARSLSDMVRREVSGVVDIIPLFDLLAAGGLSVAGSACAAEHDFDLAIERALAAPSLEGAELARMLRIHLQLRGSLQLTPDEVNAALRRIRRRFGVCNHVTFSLVFDPSLGDRVRATVLGSRWIDAPRPGPVRPEPVTDNTLPFPGTHRERASR